VLLFLLPPSEEITLECNYIQFSLGHVSNVYTCDVMRVLQANNPEVRAVFGNHSPGRIDRDVRGFLMDRSSLEFIPQSFSDFWPNLELIVMRDSGVIAITAVELQGLFNLRQISMSGSRVRILDDDVFAMNPLITQISLNNNPVESVGVCAFERLHLLRNIDMTQTNCISMMAGSRAQVVTMVSRVKSVCPLRPFPPTRNCFMSRALKSVIVGEA
jgi:hypothetical protein